MTLRTLFVAVLWPSLATAQAPQNPTSGVRPQRLIIRNAMIVDGHGTPAEGPMDVVVVDRTITRLIPRDPVSAGRGGARDATDPGTVEIDATGKYVLPGLINAHAHMQDERAGVPQPIEYEFKIWLACGITTIRDVGSETRKALAWRDSSARGLIVAPLIPVYPMLGRPDYPDSARARLREFKAMGADGVKFLGLDREVMRAAEEEAH